MWTTKALKRQQSGPTDAYVAEEAEGVTISCRLPQELHGDGDTDEVDINSDITSDGEYLWLRYLPPESCVFAT